MKKVILTIVLITTMFIGTYAQELITGNVSAYFGELAGVHVIISGTTNGTTTDYLGNYSIKAKKGDVLYFSFFIMEDISVKIGDAKIVDVKMYGKGEKNIWKKNNSQTFLKHYSNGKKECIGKIVKGKQNGIWKYYYENGQLDRKISYIKGKKDGVEVKYYRNGHMKSIGSYVQGKKIGKWKFYYENGILQRMGKYADGKITGEWEYYYENERLSRIRLWKEDKLMDVISCFDNEGNPLDAGTISNGNGIVKEYDKNGKLVSETHYLNGNVTKVKRI